MSRKVASQPLQLLELNVISAQDLAQVTRKMRTYAVAWVNPERKLATRVNIQDHNNPAWKQKFVFRVDDEFLHGETSALMIEIYALHWFRDVHVGTVRVIIGNLIPPPQTRQQYQHQHQVQLGRKRLVALQVRRRSGFPQGILNIGVALLNTSRRSMPLYSQISPAAVVNPLLMGEQDANAHHHNNNNKCNNKEDKRSHRNQFLLPFIPKPELRRTKSDSSSMFGSSMVGKIIKKKTHQKSSSMTSGSEIIQNNNISNTHNMKFNLPATFGANGALAKPTYGSGISLDKSLAKIGKELNGVNVMTNFQFGTSKPGNGITESELGPSASEIAAMVAKNKNQHRLKETESEIMGSWNLESSMEGLQSKLRRWRTELPPAYDGTEFSSHTASSFTDAKTLHNRNRRSSHSGGALSCLIICCGLQCYIVCGGSGNPEETDRVKRSHSAGNFRYLWQRT